MRGQERRIRLSQNQLRTSHRQRLLNTLRILESHRAGKAHVPAALIANRGKLRAARVAVEHGTFRGTLFIQDAHNVLVRVAVVNLQRQVVLLRNANMLAEAVVLRLHAFFAGTEIVQAGLTNSAHTVGSGQAVQGCQRLVKGSCLRQLGRGVRVNGDGGEHTLVGLSGGHGIEGGGNIASDLHDGADAELLTGVERIAGADFYLAVEQVHVSVVVHDGVGQRLGGRRKKQVATASVLTGRGAAAGALPSLGVANTHVELRLVGGWDFAGHDTPALRKHGSLQLRGGGQGVPRQGGEGVQVLLGDGVTGVILAHGESFCVFAIPRDSPRRTTRGARPAGSRRHSNNYSGRFIIPSGRPGLPRTARAWRCRSRRPRRRRRP